MAEARIQEANECVKRAEKALKTSMIGLKFKPDFDSAASEYERAAVCMKNAQKLAECKDMYLKAAENHEKNGVLFHTAKCKEQAAYICKDLKQMDEAERLMETAADIYAESGTPDTSAMALDKAAKFFEQSAPEKAIKQSSGTSTKKSSSRANKPPSESRSAKEVDSDTDLPDKERMKKSKTKKNKNKSSASISRKPKKSETKSVGSNAAEERSVTKKKQPAVETKTKKQPAVETKTKKHNADAPPEPAPPLPNSPRKPITLSDKSMHETMMQLLRLGCVGEAADGLLFDADELKGLLANVEVMLMSQTSLVAISSPVIVVGDLHGSYRTLFNIFELNGWPGEQSYLFLGDYVDRGDRSIEVIVLLFCCLVQYPDTFHLLRGNHEAQRINMRYGFYDDVKKVYGDEVGEEVWTRMNQTFAALPIAGLVNGRVLGMHGGLSPHLKSLEDVLKIQRPIVSTSPTDNPLAHDLMWADPTRADCSGAGLKGVASTQRKPGLCSRLCRKQAKATRYKSDGPCYDQNIKRQTSVMFDQVEVERMLELLDIDLIIRAHEVQPYGYAFFANRRLLTVFSRALYGNSQNFAAVARISYDNKIYKKALELVQETDRSRMHSEFLNRLTKLYLKLEMYPEAVSNIQTEIDTYIDVKEALKVGRLTTGLVLVQLMRGDSIAADKSYQASFRCPGFEDTDDAAIIGSLLTAWDGADEEKFNQCLSRPQMRAMDNEFLRLMKKLKCPKPIGSQTTTGDDGNGGEGEEEDDLK